MQKDVLKSPILPLILAILKKNKIITEVHRKEESLGYCHIVIYIYNIKAYLSCLFISLNARHMTKLGSIVV